MMEIKFTTNRSTTTAAATAAMERALEMIGIVAEGHAKSICPVDTGNLRNSISHASDGQHAVIGTNVEYAPYQELGTRLMPATNNGQGFLRPAVTRHLSEYKAIVESELHNA